MSLTKVKVKRPLITGGAGILGVCGLLVTAYAAVPVSGAMFFDQKTARVTAKTSTLGFSLGGQQGPIEGDTFDMTFDDLVPNNGSVRMYVLKNTGDRTGRVTLTTSSFRMSGGHNPDASLFSITVPEFGGEQLAKDGASVSIGSVSPGESVTFNVNARLDQAAGNEWQGVTVSGLFKISMEVQ